MPRTSKPYWKSSHRCYYSQVAGRLYRLDPDETKARQMHSVILAGAGSPHIAPGTPHAATPHITVAVLTQLYMSDAKRRMAQRTIEVLGASLRDFASDLANLSAESIRGRHIASWIDSRPSWGDAARRTAAGHVRMCWRWATDMGYLDSYHLARLKLPEMPRTECISEADAARFRESLSGPLADWWDVGVSCGARPSELAGMRSEEVSPDRRSGIVRGKMARKQGPRPVWFHREAVLVLERLIRANPTGPVLRAPSGAPWHQKHLEKRFRLAGEACGVCCPPKQTRKLFVSRLVAAGVQDSVVARLAGHASITTTRKFYLGFEAGTLLAALDRCA